MLTVYRLFIMVITRGGKKMKINGSKLMEIRESKGLTRAEAALVADVTHARMWQIEKQYKTVMLNNNIARALANYLGVKVKDFAA